MSKTRYIHYGSREFKSELFDPPRNRCNMTKPDGGLWASPVDAQYGWRDWCEANQFRECNEDDSFTFELTENANVIHIYKLSDLDDLPQCKDERLSFLSDWFVPDFEWLVKRGCDAIELHLSEEDRTGCGFLEGLYWSLYGWDCDSILILNPNIVVEVE